MRRGGILAKMAKRWNWADKWVAVYKALGPK